MNLVNKSKLISLKYKTKLRFKQPPWYWYLVFPWTGLGLCVLCWAIDYSFNLLNINYALPKLFYLLAILTTILLALFAWFISPLSFSKVQRMRRKLKRIIEENKFYYQNSESQEIRSSMIIKFKWIEEKFFLEVYPNGGKYTSKMNELTTIFQTALNMNVIAVQEDFADHTTYILSNESDNHIDSTDKWEM